MTLRRNPSEVRVTNGQKPSTKIIYIVLQTSVGLSKYLLKKKKSFLAPPNVENKCWTLYETLPLTNRVRAPYCKLRTEFFPHRFMAQARSARAINRRGKRGCVTYSTDRENEVSKIFIISLLRVWRARERFLFTRKGFKFLTHFGSKTTQFEIVVKWLLSR